MLHRFAVHLLVVRVAVHGWSLHQATLAGAGLGPVYARRVRCDRNGCSTVRTVTTYNTFDQGRAPKARIDPRLQEILDAYDRDACRRHQEEGLDKDQGEDRGAGRRQQRSGYDRPGLSPMGRAAPQMPQMPQVPPSSPDGNDRGSAGG